MPTDQKLRRLPFWKVGSPEHVRFWEAVNRYVVACGGNPSASLYGNLERQQAVNAVELAMMDLADLPE